MQRDLDNNGGSTLKEWRVYTCKRIWIIMEGLQMQKDLDNGLHMERDLVDPTPFHSDIQTLVCLLCKGVW